MQFYLVTNDVRYRDTALHAGEWAYDNTYTNVEYRGGTCDNADVYDKESAIYGIFGFLALYDLTGESKWLEAMEQMLTGPKAKLLPVNKEAFARGRKVVLG